MGKKGGLNLIYILVFIIVYAPYFIINRIVKIHDSKINSIESRIQNISNAMKNKGE